MVVLAEELSVIAVMWHMKAEGYPEGFRRNLCLDMADYYREKMVFMMRSGQVWKM